jgi:hypothetical protein
MVHTVVRIIGDVDDHTTKLGRRRGPVGTGFLLSIISEVHDDFRFGYVVTAHHVLNEQTKVEVQMSDPFGNGALYEPVQVDDWRQPISDLDLAIAPLPPWTRALSTLEFETNLMDTTMLDLSLGVLIHYIGILAPLDRVMVRTGALGASHQWGIKHDGDYDYPAHLVDCRSYGGFSGSPCFVNLSYAALEPGGVVPHLPPPGEMPPLGRLYHVSVLCGMFTEHLTEKLPGFISRYGVGVMLRVDEIKEAIMSDELRRQRQKLDEEVSESKGDSDLRNVAANAPDPDEFERFEKLTRELVNTPKPEKNSGAK